MNFNPGDRRPIRSRNTYLANQAARYLIKLGFKPNQISFLSLLFAGFAAICLILSNQPDWQHPYFLIMAACFILLRLLCNLFDGMIAIEGGFASKSGEIFNDLPDRPSDAIILIATGFAAYTVPYAEQLGWLAALFAVMTAYVRLLGKSAGTQQFFLGPMAKQHRMFLMIVACIISSCLSTAYSHWVFVIALLSIISGCVFTILRRLKTIIAELEHS